MNMINNLLGEGLDRFILVFLDDILIYSANVGEHVEYLKKVLELLWTYEVCTKTSKWEILLWGARRQPLGQRVMGP